MSNAKITTAEAAPSAKLPVVVKKYANRRLYNTESSSYITLDNLAAMVREQRDFVVYDARTGEDITRGVLTQIIVEEESKGRAMLPTVFLRQLIGLYGDSLQQFVPSYLEQAMTSFALQQEQVRSVMQQTMGNLFPGMSEVGRQNMAMMERAMSLFTPFYRNGTDGGEPTEEASATPAPAATAQQTELAAMHGEIESLRRQLAAARTTALAAELMHGATQQGKSEKAVREGASGTASSASAPPAETDPLTQDG